jgi:hypothetical protein
MCRTCQAIRGFILSPRLPTLKVTWPKPRKPIVKIATKSDQSRNVVSQQHS